MVYCFCGVFRLPIPGGVSRTLRFCVLNIMMAACFAGIFRQYQTQNLKGYGCMPYQSEAEIENAYGYLRVLGGTEGKVAALVNRMFPEVQALAITQIKHRSCRGVHSYSSSIMVPNYILFTARINMQVSQMLAITSVLQVLTYAENDWQLRGDDLFCAQWLFDHNGTIGVSVLFMEGDDVQIVDGPLKDMEGKILRIDKRNRNALVELSLHKQACNIWLAFEWMDKVEGRSFSGVPG